MIVEQRALLMAGSRGGNGKRERKRGKSNHVAQSGAFSSRDRSVGNTNPGPSGRRPRREGEGVKEGRK